MLNNIKQYNTWRGEGFLFPLFWNIFVYFNLKKKDFFLVKMRKLI